MAARVVTILVLRVISSCGTKSKIGAYRFGLDFHVRACMCAFVHVWVRNHISDMYGPILFVLGTKTTRDGKHMRIILFRDAIKDG